MRRDDIPLEALRITVFEVDSLEPRERAGLLNRTNAMKSMTVLKPLHGRYKVCEGVLGRTGLADNVLGVFQKREKNRTALLSAGYV